MNPVSVGDFATEIRAHLLEGWRATAGDPEWAVTRWLTADGVPAGVRRHPEDCGIFREWMCSERVQMICLWIPMN